MYVCFFFVIFTSLLYFLDFTYKRYYAICLLISCSVWFSIMPSKSIYGAANGNIFFFLWLLLLPFKSSSICTSIRTKTSGLLTQFSFNICVCGQASVRTHGPIFDLENAVVITAGIITRSLYSCYLCTSFSLPVDWIPSGERKMC